MRGPSKVRFGHLMDGSIHTRPSGVAPASHWVDANRRPAFGPGLACVRSTCRGPDRTIAGRECPVQGGRRAPDPEYPASARPGSAGPPKARARLHSAES
jgi:hypothetical protein